LHLVADPLLDFRADPFVVWECQKVEIAHNKATAVSIDFYDELPIHLPVAATPAIYAETSAGGVCEFCDDTTS
jgi:hypothetical protein